MARAGRSRTREELEIAVDVATKATGGVAALAVLWLSYGLLSGQTGPQMDLQAGRHVYNVVSNITSVLQISSSLFAILFAVVTFRSRDAVIAMGFIGLALAIGMPALVEYVVGRSVPLRGATSAEYMMSVVCTQTGYFVMAVTVVRGSIHLIESIVEFGRSLSTRGTVGFEKKAGRNSLLAANPHVLTPCWKLPYCRDGIREVCPAFEARKTCWKFGKGCYCDDEMILKLLTSDPTLSRQGGAYMQATLAEMKSAPKKKTKPPCEKCYIFLEHQRIKHKLLSPLTVPAAIGLMYFGYPLYQNVFRAVLGVLPMFGRLIMFDPRFAQSQQTPEWITGMESLFAVVLGFFLLVYLTKGLESAIFRWKL